MRVVLKIAGVKHWLWRAVDQAGIVLDALVQRRRDKQAAKRLLRKLLKKEMQPPRGMITDKLASYGAAKREVMPGIEHRQHKRLNSMKREDTMADLPPLPELCFAEIPVTSRHRYVGDRFCYMEAGRVDLALGRRQLSAGSGECRRPAVSIGYLLPTDAPDLRPDLVIDLIVG